VDLIVGMFIWPKRFTVSCGTENKSVTSPHSGGFHKMTVSQYVDPPLRSCPPPPPMLPPSYCRSCDSCCSGYWWSWMLSLLPSPHTLVNLQMFADLSL
jgi:hypothetical protein